RFHSRNSVDSLRYRGQDLGMTAIVLAQFIDGTVAPNQPGAIFVEHLRHGMTETVDGLIDVAYAKKRAADQVDQAPLQAIRILKLVHQDVVESRSGGLANC